MAILGLAIAVFIFYIIARLNGNLRLFVTFLLLPFLMQLLVVTIFLLCYCIGSALILWQAHSIAGSLIVLALLVAWRWIHVLKA
jgi:hypothetical protein